jgi:hypothetical protein
MSNPFTPKTPRKVDIKNKENKPQVTAKSTKRKQKLSDEDVLPGPSKNQTKRLKRDSSWDMEGFFSKQAKETQKFQNDVLARMDKSNETYEQMATRQADFQDRFLGLLAKLTD